MSATTMIVSRQLSHTVFYNNKIKMYANRQWFVYTYADCRQSTTPAGVAVLITSRAMCPGSTVLGWEENWDQ